MSIRWCAKCGEPHSQLIASCANCGSRSWVYSEKMVGIVAEKKDFSKMQSESEEALGANLEFGEGASKPDIPIKGITEIPPIVTKQLKNSAKIAINSARIVNGYGSTFQIVGMVIAGIEVIVGILLAKSLGNFLVFLVAAIIAAITVAIFAVQGALFRMISNYIIAKLED